MGGGAEDGGGAASQPLYLCPKPHHNAAVLRSIEALFERARRCPAGTAELEAKLRATSGGASVERDVFEAVLDACVSYGGWHQCDPTWTVSEDVLMDGDLRCTRRADGSCRFVRKQPIQDVDIDVVQQLAGGATTPTPLQLRVSLRSETPIVNPAPATQRWVRIKQRRSFVHAGRWSIDLTRVWSAPSAAAARRADAPCA